MSDELTRALFEEAGPERADGGNEWRRGGSRRSIREGVDIEIVGTGEHLSGYIIDVTPDAIGLTCRRALAGQELIRVTRIYSPQQETFQGRVIHATQTLSGYRVGVRLAN